MRKIYEIRRECERVNKLLLADARKQGLGTKSSRQRLDEARHDDSNAFSFWAQLEYREYIRRQLERRDTISASHLIKTGAYLLGISPVTAKRYLSALASEIGPFNQHGDLIMINPHYVPSEDDTYWLDDASDPVEGETA
jgi:hypothetical protein